MDILSFPFLTSKGSCLARLLPCDVLDSVVCAVRGPSTRVISLFPKVVNSFTVTIFAISQSEPVSTVLFYCDIKSLTWYGYGISMVTWPNLCKVGKYLIVPFPVRPGNRVVWCRHGCFGSTTSRGYNTNHTSTKLAWYAAKAYHWSMVPKRFY